MLPGANHLQLEAKVGTHAEMKSLQRSVPPYFTVVRTWLKARVPDVDWTVRSSKTGRIDRPLRCPPVERS